MVDMNVVLGVVITFIVQNMIYMMIAGVVTLHFHRRKLHNPIDVLVLELTQNGVVARKEIGRQEVVQNKGYRTVTVSGWSRKKIKDDFGYHISDDDMVLSGHGRKRKFLVIAIKDKLAAALHAVPESEDFTDKEKELLQKAYDKFSTPGKIKFFDIPKTLSLKPILKEQTRFAIDVAKDTIEVEGDDARNAARRMMFIAAGLFIFTLIICLVIIVVVLNQAPQLANSQVAEAAATTVTNIPGVPGN